MLVVEVSIRQVDDDDDDNDDDNDDNDDDEEEGNDPPISVALLAPHTRGRCGAREEFTAAPALTLALYAPHLNFYSHFTQVRVNFFTS